MSRHPELNPWMGTVSSHFPRLSKPLATGLAWESFGLIVARSCGLTAIAGLSWPPQGRALRERCRDGVPAGGPIGACRPRGWSRPSAGLRCWGQPASRPPGRVSRGALHAPGSRGRPLGWPRPAPAAAGHSAGRRGRMARLGRARLPAYQARGRAMALPPQGGAGAGGTAGVSAWRPGGGCR
jgi:hypothetical protein